MELNINDIECEMSLKSTEKHTESLMNAKETNQILKDLSKINAHARDCKANAYKS